MCLAALVVEVDLLKILEAETLHPGAVVERLGDNVARGPVTLELKDMGAAVSIEGQQIYVSPIAGRNLPPDDEQVRSGHGWILSEHVLKTLLEVQRRRRQLVRSGVGHPPDRHFNGHGSSLG